MCHRQQYMNKTVHSCAIILYTCQETLVLKFTINTAACQ